MGLVKKVDLTEGMTSSRGKELESSLYNQFNEFHSRDYRPDKDIEQIIFQQKLLEYNLIGVRTPRPDTVIFSPSGASKCQRELWLKAMGEKAYEDKFPYHRRWTRNSSAVHEAVQRDLLYMSKFMKNPAFKVKMLDNGLPAWESNIKNFVEIEHNGEVFTILGMMDGVLNYRDGSDIGFEFKTKSNSIGQVGSYKMKAPAPYHIEQCVAYNLLFGMDEFVLMYEAVAKDQWAKGAEAKPDIRTFYHQVTAEERLSLLDRLASVSRAVRLKEIPSCEPEKCMFCPYKSFCGMNAETKNIDE